MTSSRLQPGVARGERRSLRHRVLATLAAVAALHAVAVILLLAGAAGGGGPLAAGLVATAYLTGVRHSYDWDHIAAIDNSTRRLVAMGREPASVGLAFSLGHSSVVMAAGVLVVAGAAFMSSLLQEGTAANTVLALVGGSVSGGFLLLIGCFNAAAARRAWTLRARAHAGAALEPHQLEAQGLLTRLLARPLSRLVTPRGMYVLGFLFGLGFDTASTMSLLILTASASLSGVSAWTLASLPFFFAAGMCLCDSLNGFAVLRLYRTAWQDPARKLGFNAAVTGASAVSALFIAAITIGGVAHRGLGLHDPLTTWLAGVDLGEAGLALVALMLAFWGVAALLERARRRPEPTVREP